MGIYIHIQDDWWLKTQPGASLQKSISNILSVISYMTGIYLLNSTSSPERSHQSFVLKEDDSLGVNCTEKAREIKRLSFSNRDDKEEERTGSDAYLEMIGSSSKKGR